MAFLASNGVSIEAFDAMPATEADALVRALVKLQKAKGEQTAMIIRVCLEAIAKMLTGRVL